MFGIFEDDFPFPQVGYVNFLEGILKPLFFAMSVASVGWGHQKVAARLDILRRSSSQNDERTDRLGTDNHGTGGLGIMCRNW